jgi:hypothetical protein
MRARQDGQSGGPGEGPPKAVVGEVGPDREVPVLYTVQRGEPERLHGAVRPDAPDRPPRRPGPLVGLAQLDLVVRRSLRDVFHSVLVSTGTRSPSSLTSTIRSGPGLRRV